MEGKPQGTKWYFKTYWIVTTFLCVGPLVLPLVWFNPRFSRKKKAVITIIIVILSYYLGVWLINSLRTMKKYYDMTLQNNF